MNVTFHCPKINRGAGKSWMVLLLACGLTCLGAMGAESKPNIIVILADDLGWADVTGGQTTYGGGSDFYETPNIARLAKEGMAFSSAYTCPNCAPTRAALASGQYSTRTKVYNVGDLNRRSGKPKLVGPDQNEDVAASLTTIAEMLKSAGYVTAHAGKYHVGGHEGGEVTLPLNSGFDVNYGGSSAGNPGNYFAKEKAPGVWEFHKSIGPELDEFAAPYDAAYATRYRSWVSPKKELPKSLYGTPKHVGDAVADAVLEFMERQTASGKPFYVQFHEYLVHTPRQGRPDLVTKYSAKQKSAPSKMGQDRSDDYAAMVEQIDQCVGRVLAYLDDPDGDGNTSDSISTNTLVIFYSDNGGERGSTSNTPLRGAKGMFTEGGIRVPLIVRMPGTVPSGTTNDSPVNMADIYPTLAEFAGAKLPNPEQQPLDGTSLRPLLTGRVKSLGERSLYWHFPGYLDDRAEPTSVIMRELQGKRYKLLYFYESQKWSLYNLTDDLAEKTDLLAGGDDTTLRPVLSKLSKDLREWLDQTGAIYPTERSTGETVPPPTPSE